MDSKLPLSVVEGQANQSRAGEISATSQVGEPVASVGAVVEQTGKPPAESVVGVEGELLSAEPVDSASKTGAVAVEGAEGINLSSEPVPDVNIPVPTPSLPVELDEGAGGEAVKDDDLRRALGDVSKALGGDLSSAQKFDADMAEARKSAETD